MTCWTLALYRILAVACWWAALCLIVAAFVADHPGVGLTLFVTGCLAVAVGIGMWKGEQ